MPVVAAASTIPLPIADVIIWIATASQNTCLDTKLHTVFIQIVAVATINLLRCGY